VIALSCLVQKGQHILVVLLESTLLLMNAKLEVKRQKRLEYDGSAMVSYVN
jgi:hypothetical protein